jgi:DNA-binding SARP family transcriptional activator
VVSQVWILGPIEVEVDDDRLARIPRGRTLSLLALLLVHHGTIVALDRIVDELWEGDGPQNARNAVQVVASRLRAAIGDGMLVSEAHGYGVRAPGEIVDADRFEKALRRGRAQLERGEPWEAASTLRDALALWRGPALADVSDEGFAQPEIARLEDLRLMCLADRVDAELACGRHEHVAGELEALVRRYPLNERLRGQQMLALYRSGRQAEALDAYRHAYEALADGLGIEPSPELRELQAAILRHELPAPAPRAERTAAPRDVRRRVTCVFSRLKVPHADPESLRAWLERHYDAVRAASARHGGSLAELRGDAVLVVFGAPLVQEDDALRALRMASELGAGREPLAVGVSTGEVLAPAGSPETAPLVGEAPGNAEALARAAAAGEIQVDDATWRLVRHGARAAALRDGGFRLLSVDAEAPAVRRQFDRPLVGRRDELERLRQALARVTQARAPELLALIGDAGIGKTRLATELAATAGERGRLLSGRCPAYGEGMTYWPLRAIVHQALELAPPEAHQLAVAVGIEQGNPGADPAWALLRLCEVLARTQPLVVLIDDAHLAESTLLELLTDVVRRLRDAPVLVVLVARPDLLERDAGLAGRATVLELGPLSDGASATLLEAISTDRLDPGEQRRIAAAAGGNPLFLEQVVAFLAEGGAADALPPALHTLLAARLDRLDTTERSVLALGAVAGDAFDPAAVHALAEGVTRAELERACGRLVGRDLLVAGDDPALRFRHGLVREAAYASLAKSARARLHARHAGWLDALGDDLPEADARIALHLETAWRYQEEIGAARPPS